MAEEAMTTDLLALTEKKVNMTLDDLIKMSRKNDSKRKRTQRRPIKNRWHPKGNAPHGNARAQPHMDFRSAVRQGVLAQRRSNFQDHLFPKTAEAARKAANSTFCNKATQWNGPRSISTLVRRNASTGNYDEKMPQTLDALFANMKEQRSRAISQLTTRGNGRQNHAVPLQITSGNDRPTGMLCVHERQGVKKAQQVIRGNKQQRTLRQHGKW